jgi:hypothetical protein
MTELNAAWARTAFAVRYGYEPDMAAEEDAADFAIFCAGVAAARQALAQPDAGEAEFELHCDGDYAASACGPRERAWREIQHYAAQYAKDGPIEIFEVTRTLAAAQPATKDQP